MFAISRFGKDEELGKRDDDYKDPSSKPGAAGQEWWNWRGVPRRRMSKGRVVAILGILLFMWGFFHFMPEDLGTPMRRPPPGTPRNQPLPFGPNAVQKAQAPQTPPKGAPPKTDVERTPGESQHYYNGQIRFYELGGSLAAISRLGGYLIKNKNVLFAASSLKSVTNLLQLACDMGKWNRNHVHFAVMGRYDIPLDDLLRMNGIDKEACQVFWHDARPDYAEYSTDARAEESVRSALGHCETYMHPQVYITDDSILEDTFFVRALRPKAKQLDHPVIEVPKDRWDQYTWMTRLDVGSLRAWHTATVDILIHAPSESAGSLLRLLKSILAADYAGLPSPRLIIELPSSVEPTVQGFINRINWPPSISENPLQRNQLILRHRISARHAGPEEASVRFLESFYPTNTANSHVLLLSPQTQLSPMYYHYMMYTLLEYRYSEYAQEAYNDELSRLLGVSLDIPTTNLNGSAAFTPPSPSLANSAKYTSLSPDTDMPFLMQAPNSNAALYFGDKWVEIHSFLTQRIQHFHTSPAKTWRPKLVSEDKPAWTEYVLELIRARGWTLLYPAFSSHGEGMVTVHEELKELPEEFSSDEMLHKGENFPQEGTDPSSLPTVDEPFLTTPVESVKGRQHDEASLIPPSRPLHKILPFDADLPELPHLPLLSHAGSPLGALERITTAQDYADDFRREVGMCSSDSTPKGQRRKVRPMDARDLFCTGAETEDDYEEVPIDLPAGVPVPSSPPFVEEIDRSRRKPGEAITSIEGVEGLDVAKSKESTAADPKGGLGVGDRIKSAISEEKRKEEEAMREGYAAEDATTKNANKKMEMIGKAPTAPKGGAEVGA